MDLWQALAIIVSQRHQSKKELLRMSKLSPLIHYSLQSPKSTIARQRAPHRTASSIPLIPGEGFTPWEVLGYLHWCPLCQIHKTFWNHSAEQSAFQLCCPHAESIPNLSPWGWKELGGRHSVLAETNPSLLSKQPRNLSGGIFVHD